jgi:hypothetical protein
MFKTTIYIALLVVASSGGAFSQSLKAEPSVTTTTLIVSPKEGSVVAGTALTLTARVLRNGTPVTRGTVLFCEAAASRCADLSILGTAQLTGNGSAGVNLILGVGTYSIRAIFRGTPHGDLPALGSASTLKRITVSAKNANGSAKSMATRSPGSK